MPGRLNDKIAVVTGSTQGIGRACVERFAREGARVVVSDHGADPSLGMAVVERIKAQGGVAHYCKANVRIGEEVRHLIRDTIKEYGRIDVLMNNAITGQNGSVMDMHDEEWDIMFAATIKAIAIACKEAIPTMIKNGGGSIINTSSIHGILAGKNDASYNALKGAIINFSRSMAVDYGRYAIRCNALCPGRILTENKKIWLDANPREVVRQQCVYPLGRPGTMEEIASAALFLACDDSSFITGHALVVDGGLTAQLPDYAAMALHDTVLPQKQ
jgi:NAD(P)-dependent dehydrogenase (short-subunit alcohol dehydrogenase family)